MEKKVFVSDVNGRRDRELELELSDARWSESTSSQRHEFIQHPDCLSLSSVFLFGVCPWLPFVALY